MDDLISRKALSSDLCEDREEGTFEFTHAQVEAADKIIRYVVSRIEKLPSVPAVPLDKLCEFLEKCGADSYCGTCKQIMGGCFTDGNGCGSEHFWKELLTKWMEEQDA